jgi:predicted MFS family arabinose efflux permease
MLRPVFVTQFVFNTAFFLILAIFVPHAVHNLGLTAAGVGVTLGMFGVGMVVGALFAPGLMRWLRFGAVVATGPFAGLLGSIMMALTIWVPVPLLAGLGFFLLGVGPILWVISTTTLRQTVTPPDLLGRVSAINIMAYGARPIGSALGALIGGLYGIHACLLAAVAGFLLQAVVIARSPVVELGRQPEMARE